MGISTKTGAFEVELSFAVQWQMLRFQIPRNPSRIRDALEPNYRENAVERIPVADAGIGAADVTGAGAADAVAVAEVEAAVSAAVDAAHGKRSD